MAHALHNLVLHQVKRDLLYFRQQFYRWHPVKMLFVIFLATFSSLPSGNPQISYISGNTFTSGIRWNAIYYISGNTFISGKRWKRDLLNIWQHRFSDIWWKCDLFYFWQNFHIWIVENVISFISAKIFISGIRWKRDLSLFLAAFGNVGSHFCISPANFIKVPVHYSQQWQKKIIAMT